MAYSASNTYITPGTVNRIKSKSTATPLSTLFSTYSKWYAMNPAVATIKYSAALKNGLVDNSVSTTGRRTESSQRCYEPKSAGQKLTTCKISGNIPVREHVVDFGCTDFRCVAALEAANHFAKENEDPCNNCEYWASHVHSVELLTSHTEDNKCAHEARNPCPSVQGLELYVLRRLLELALHLVFYDSTHDTLHYCEVWVSGIAIEFRWSM